MFSTRAFRRAAWAAVLVIFAGSASARAQPSAATLYRIFLHDGSTLVSYGEFARVADQVVFSIPMGGTDEAPTLQLVSIPSSVVDWDQTDAYAESARASRYGATRGPEDFALLNGAVTRALTDIGLAPDPKRKIEMATEARQNLMRWSSEHYGYRAPDVAQLATMFDDVISDARAASGLPGLGLALVANMAAPPSVPLMSAPTVEETVADGLRATTLMTSAAERESALRALQHTLDEVPAAEWVVAAREKVNAALAADDRIDASYAALTKRVVQQADRDVRRGRVVSLQQLIARALRQDDQMGRTRPEEMASLLALLDSRLDSARCVRLARDHWAMRQSALRHYREAVASPLATLIAWRASLEEIQNLAGPSRLRLSRLSSALELATAELAAIDAPPEASEVHGLLRTVLQLAARAADGREQAITTGDMQTAWQASSAAAGALLLIDKVTDGLKALAAPPAAPIR
jgi:hypothetical protein